MKRSGGRPMGEYDRILERLRADPRTVPLLGRLCEKVAKARAGEDQKITLFDVFGPFEVLCPRPTRNALRAYLAVVAEVSGMDEIYEIHTD